MPGRQRAAGTVRVCGQSEEVACRSDLRGVGSRHRIGELENQGSRATSPASPRRGDLTVATCSIMAPRRSSKPSMAYGSRSRRPASGAAEVSVPRYAPGAEPDWERESGWPFNRRARFPQSRQTCWPGGSLAHPIISLPLRIWARHDLTYDLQCKSLKGTIQAGRAASAIRCRIYEDQ